MVKDHSFRLAARGLLYAPSHRQDNTYDEFCYTSRGALAGSRPRTRISHDSAVAYRTTQLAREETRCRQMGYSFRLASWVLLYAPSHRQDSSYHSLCYSTGAGCSYDNYSQEYKCSWGPFALLGPRVSKCLLCVNTASDPHYITVTKMCCTNSHASHKSTSCIFADILFLLSAV